MAGHVCPWWLGYFLLSPLRNLVQNPNKILGQYIQDGMSVMDIGSGMGYFSLPMAKMVGEKGKVICVDLQDKMLKTLEKRAKKAGLSHIIVTRKSSENSLEIQDMSQNIDFVLAFAVVHEVPDTKKFFSEIYSCMKPNARLLIAEPKAHVSAEEFNEANQIAQSQGFEIIDYPKINKSRSILMTKK